MPKIVKCHITKTFKAPFFNSSEHNIRDNKAIWKEKIQVIVQVHKVIKKNIDQLRE